MKLSKYQATQERQTARAVASARGHNLSRFLALVKDHTWYAGCTTCGRDVTVLADPQPNQTHISGAAMAENCVWPNGIKPK